GRPRRAPPAGARTDQRPRGRPRGQHRAHPRAHRARPRRGGRDRALPRAGRHRLSPRGPAPARALPAGDGRGARLPGRGRPGHRRAGRLPGALGRRLQRAGRAGRGRAALDLPQDPPAQLRRLRRAPVLPGRRERRHPRHRRRPRRPDHLRGHVGARPARLRRGARGSVADPQRLGLPVSRRQGRRARAHDRPAGARQHLRGRLLQPGRRPGRAHLRRAFLRGRPRRSRAGPGAAVRGVAAHRHRRPAGGHQRTAARPPPAPAGAHGAARRRPAAGPRAPVDTRGRGAGRGAGTGARAGGRGLRRARPRPARLRGEERLPARGARALGRHRLDAGGAGGDRRPRRRSRHHRGDAVAVLLVGHAGRCAHAGRQSGRRLPGAADRPGNGDLRRHARRGLRRHGARPHRGEPPGAHPRQPADGAVEQVRLAGPDHRQQVRGLGGLFDALRRLGRRLRGDQGRAQAAGLPALRLPQRDRGPGRRADPRVDRHARAERRAATGPARRGLAARLRHPRPDPRGLRRARRQPRADAARRPARGRDRPGHPPGRLQRVQAPAGPSRHQDHAAGLRPGPAHADHQRLPRDL
ncbi:MAG: NAD synthetase / Glutamine amidotransferase chain of NAD synthetase, partial [uncultured Solirubrobacteraceae bacterium]